MKTTRTRWRPGKWLVAPAVLKNRGLRVGVADDTERARQLPLHVRGAGLRGHARPAQAQDAHKRLPRYRISGPTGRATPRC